MAGPFEFLSGMFGGGGGMESPTADSPAYTGPRAGSGDVFGPAGIDWLLGRPSPGQVKSYGDERSRLIDRRDELEARDAQAALAGKAAEIQEANPNAMPDQLFKMMMQDPDARSKLMKVPAGKHGQVLKDIMERLQPTPPKSFTLGPGQAEFSQPQRSGQPATELAREPLSPAQQGAGRGGPRLVPIRDKSGAVTGTGMLITNAQGEPEVVPIQGAGGPRQYQHTLGAGAGAPQPQPGGAPQPGAGAPQPGAVPRGQTQPGQAGGSFPPSPGPGPQVPPGQVSPDLGTPGLRKADMVDGYGWLGQATRVIGGVAGNIDPKAQAARQQQTHQLNQELRAAFLAMNGSTRLARELKAKEGILPPEDPGLTWNPYKGIDNLISLSQWTDEKLAHAESEANSPYASTATVRAAQEDQVRLRNFRAALGPHEELVAKKQELAAGKGGTTWEELKNAIPGSETATRFFGQGMDAARGAADKARGAVEPAAPNVSPEQFTQTIQGLDAGTFAGLARERHLMTPEQQKAYSAELARRKAELKGRPKGSVAPPEPAPRKSQGRLPEGYRLPGDNDTVPPQ